MPETSEDFAFTEGLTIQCRRCFRCFGRDGFPHHRRQAHEKCSTCHGVMVGKGEITGHAQGCGQLICCQKTFRLSSFHHHIRKPHSLCPHCKITLLQPFFQLHDLLCTSESPLKSVPGFPLNCLYSLRCILPTPSNVDIETARTVIPALQPSNEVQVSIHKHDILHRDVLPGKYFITSYEHDEYAVVIQSWAEVNALHKEPFSHSWIFNEAIHSYSWAPGYEDGEKLVDGREYPIQYFDDAVAEQCSVGSVPIGELRYLDMKHVPTGLRFQNVLQSHHAARQRELIRPKTCVLESEGAKGVVDRAACISLSGGSSQATSLRHYSSI